MTVNLYPNVKKVARQIERSAASIGRKDGWSPYHVALGLAMVPDSPAKAYAYRNMVNVRRIVH